MKRPICMIGAAATLLAPVSALAIEIRAIPADYVFVADANPGKGYVDVMAQTIALHNNTGAPVKLVSLELTLSGADGAAVAKSIPLSRIAAQTADYAAMASQGFTVFLGAQLLNEAGLKAEFGENAALAAGDEIPAGGVALATANYLAADFAPDALTITAKYRRRTGAARTATAQIEVRRRDPAALYAPPLRGVWAMRSFPNIRSHHRFIPSNEFALDFYKIGPDGALDKGERLTPEDDYGYGEPVYAVADGEVVFVIADQVQDPAALSRREGETIEEAGARIQHYQMQRFAADFRAAAAGNIVTIKHERDGVPEYSSYGHLKAGSVQVKVGDLVKEGDVIGAVGHTGDSTLTHLHFQLNAGPDAFHSRSLPAAFEGARSTYVGQEPALFMIFEETAAN